MTTTKPIKVSDTNVAAIDAAIRSTEGRATARTATYRDVAAAVDWAEQALAVLPKRLWVGATVEWDENVVPNAYSHRAESTLVRLVRRQTGWFLTGAERHRTATRSYGRGHGRRTVTIQHADDLLAVMLDRAGLRVAQLDES
jgi:hypothetical protein